MKRQNLLTAIACMGLSACSEDYPLKAAFENGRLHFYSGGQDWFFGESGFCPMYFSVQLESGETVWRIETDLGPSDCDLFPVAYGSTPKGWKTVVAAKPLKLGGLYVIKGEGGDRYHGAFRYTERRVLSVTNEPEKAHDFPNPPYKWEDRHAKTPDRPLIVPIKP